MNILDVYPEVPAAEQEAYRGDHPGGDPVLRPDLWVFLLVSFQKVMINHEIFMAGTGASSMPCYAKAKAIIGTALSDGDVHTSFGSATYGGFNTARPYLYITAYDALSFQNHPIKLISGRFPKTGMSCSFHR